MQAYWKQVDDPDDLTGVKLNALPKFIASSTLRDPDWHNSTVLSGDILDEVTRLKQRPGGELQVHGSWGWPTPCTKPAWSTSTGCWCFPSPSGRASGFSPTALRPPASLPSTRASPAPEPCTPHSNPRRSMSAGSRWSTARK